jgi:hypothetical protein
MRARIFLSVIFLLGLAACEQDHAALPVASRAVNALKNRNMPELSTLVHPEKGVSFSPYATLHPGRDVSFTPEQLYVAPRIKRSYVWGEYDGSGEPIDLGFEAYLLRFVFDGDYTAVTPLVNTAPPRTSNTPDNTARLYPNGVVMAYFIPGSEKNKGMDFHTLRLVLEKYEGKWYLVHIAHDQWTI